MILTSDRTALSWEDLNQQLLAVKAWCARYGIDDRDRIALAIPDGPELAAATICFSSVAACAPLKPSYRRPEYDFYLTDMQATVLIVSEGVGTAARDAAKHLGTRIVELTPDDSTGGKFSLRTDMKPDPCEVVLRGSSDTALLLHTSGTSSKPKLVGLTYGNLLASAQDICRVLELGPGDQCLNVMPLFHIHGLSAVFASLASGGSVVCEKEFSAANFFSLLNEFKSTWYTASPTIHRLIRDEARKGKHTVRGSSLRFIRSASAPMTKNLIEDMADVFGVPFIEAYGMTEAGPQIASNPLTAGKRKLGSVGFPAGPEVGILDGNGEILVGGDVGEIAIRGANVTPGYVGEIRPADPVSEDGWLRTGDNGYFDDEGYLFVVGRKKEIINRGGEKISPREVESVLDSHRFVDQAICFPVEHSVLGEDIAAVLVLNTAAVFDARLDENSRNVAIMSDVREFANSRIAQFKVPQQIVFVDEIPVGSAGKINRSMLAEMLAKDLTETPSLQPDAGETIDVELRSLIANAWGVVLSERPVNSHDNFFQLGGHSLVATEVINCLNDQLGITLPSNLLFDAPTLAEFSEAVGRQIASLLFSGKMKLVASTVNKRRPDESDEIQRTSDAEQVPLTFAQRRMWFLDQMGAGCAYNLSASLELSGNLDVSALGKAIDEIRRRHGALRNTFSIVGDDVFQVAKDHETESLEMVDLSQMEKNLRAAELSRRVQTDSRRRFDLENGPVFHATLVRKDRNSYLLLLMMHHIVSDGWSKGILYRELRELYGAFVASKPSPLGDLPIQFSDCARWLRAAAQGKEMATQRDYWIQHLEGCPSAIDLPTDQPYTAEKSFRGASVGSVIAKETVVALTEVGRQVNATPFMTFFCAFNILLSRLTDQTDLVVGIPVANRSRKETEDLIGCFANTLPLRTRLEGNPSFMKLLEQVRELTINAYANQQFPFEEILNELSIDRDNRRSPLVQVMFAFQSFRDQEQEFKLAEDLVATIYPVDNESAKFDLTLYLTETERGMELRWQYNSDLFERSTIERFADCFSTLLTQLAANSKQTTGELSVVGDEERRRLVGDWNATDEPSLLGRAFLQEFQAIALKDPSRLAVVCGAGTVTYEKLNSRANQWAHYLQKRDIGPEGVVGLYLSRSIEMIAAILGVLKTGAAYMPIDAMYPRNRIQFMLDDAKPRFLIMDGGLASVKFDELSIGEGCSTVNLDRVAEELDREATSNFEAVESDESLAYLIYTSGSSGEPKGVRISRCNLDHYAQAIGAAVGIQPTDRYLHTASFAFSSSVRQLVTPLGCGSAIVLATEEQVRNQELLFELIKRERVSIIDWVPTYWQSCVDLLKSLPEATRTDLVDNEVRLLLSASEPLPVQLAVEWHEISGGLSSLINMYGQTETTGIVTTYPYHVAELPLGRSSVVPLGKPIANTRIYICDQAGHPASVGIVGEVYVGGHGVGSGYLDRTALTAERFVDSPASLGESGRLYRTGDLARYRSDGTIEIVGRMDQQIKVRGFRVEPGEIEVVLQSNDCVKESAVVWEKDAQVGHRLIAAVVPVEVASPENWSATLLSFLRSQLPGYMVPDEIKIMPKLPRLGNGKLDRKEIAKRVEEDVRFPMASAQPDRVTSVGAKKTALLRVWRDVLQVENIRDDDNFFDLGGDSIRSVQIVARANRMGLPLTLKVLFANQSIGELTRVLEPSLAANHSVTAEDKGLNEPELLVTAESLRQYGIEAFREAGLDEEGARRVTEIQLEANLRGQPTHNMVSIPRYARRIAAGVLNARPKIRIEKETPMSALLNGDNAPGQWVAEVAMECAIRKAQQTGIGIVSAKQSNHFGAAGHYVWKAACEGMIGLCTTNGPVILAPTGGRTPTLGNNPLGVGIPAKKYLPVLLDVAMSVAPRGKIALQVREGKSLENDWILDHLGRPSTKLEDLAAGLGVPIGGHKGYGLAFVMEILSGVLSGAGFGLDHRKQDGKTTPHDFGQFFLAFDPELFMPAEQFRSRVDEMIEQVKSAKKMDGIDEILVPGELEMIARQRSLQEGVRLRASTYDTLVKYADEMGLDTRIQIIEADGTNSSE